MADAEGEELIDGGDGGDGEEIGEEEALEAESVEDDDGERAGDGEGDADADDALAYRSTSLATRPSEFVAEARAYPRLSPEQEAALARAFQEDGDLGAARRLALHNLRLVSAIAMEYRRRTSAAFQDLLQEGSVGLLQAIRKWDPEKGARFSTYAVYWIRAYILRFILTNTRLIHTGNTRAGRKLFYRLERERARLRAQGFEPDVKLLAAHFDVDEDTMREVSRHLDSTEVSTAARTHDEGMSVGERLEADVATPEASVARTELAHRVRAAMIDFEDALEDERELAIWRDHLTAPDPASLSELGDRFGVSKQRMGQISKRLKDSFRAALESRYGDEIRLDWLEE